MSPQELKQVAQLLVSKTLLEQPVTSTRPRGETAVTVVRSLCDGRRPPGLYSCPEEQSPGVGGYLSRMAFYEEASIDAFHALAAELRAHGFPEVLAKAAERAAADELRHAQWLRALAAKHGALGTRPLVKQTGVRSLEELAIDNAVEGCGREAFGSLVGWYQAATAGDDLFREVIMRIADDETRHAALSYAIHTVARFRVSSEVRRRIDEVREEALTTLASSVAERPPATLAKAFGLPSGSAARRLAQDFANTVLAKAA